MEERILAFAGATLLTVYALDDEDHELRLVETAGTTAAGYGLREWYSLSGRSPAASAFRAGLPLWLSAAEAVAYHEDGPQPPQPEAPLGVLPLETGGRRLGCLVVVGDVADGFGTEQRGFLKRYADAIAVKLDTRGRPSGAAGNGPCAPCSVLGPGLHRLRVGSIVLVPGTGLIEADATACELVGVPVHDFDGRVETLLAPTVPEDLPALMAVIEPSGRVFDGRELEFQVRRSTGELRRLRLSCRMQGGTAYRPERVIGLVADVSDPQPRSDASFLVRRLSAALAGAMTVREVCRAVVALREPLGADRVALVELQADKLVGTVLDPPQAAAWPQFWRSQWPDPPIRALPTLRAALREDRLNLWPAGAGLEAALAEVGPGGLAVLPLHGQGGVAGACLVGWGKPHEFSSEERFLLTAVAGMVGQALMRAHAYDAEQQLATMLQRSLLPRRLPALPGGVAVARYQPAMRGLQVGGDWYDVIALPEGRVALVIGDVQGHSAAAATIMGQMRTAIRAYAVEGHPPDVVVSHANRLLVGMETDLFATCCYVDLDMEQGNAWFVRAGHLPPLLRRPDGSTEEVTVEGGLPLGVLAEAEFPMTAIALAPGTVLALMTDGLVESTSLPLEEGLRRVRDALSKADPADAGHMADALLAGRGPCDDDVALLLLHYSGMADQPIRAGYLVWRLPDAVMHARRFTARTLRSWKVQEEADVVLLVVSELVTNALVHTNGAVRLDLTLFADRLRVAVSDSSPRAPAKPAITHWEATGGRGILLVEAMSASWGCIPVGGGKQVWSEIHLPPPGPVGGDAGAGPGRDTRG